MRDLVLPIEMLACGGAVIASTAGSVVEMVGGQAHLVDAQDLAGWPGEHGGRILPDDDWHATLRHGSLDVVRHFTWQRCAQETFRVYGEVLGKKKDISKSEIPLQSSCN